MGKVRVIIETNPSVRKSLDDILSERGVTLTEWFIEKISEDSVTPSSLTEDISPINLELESPATVMKALREVDWSFANENTSHTTHGIHPYPAKFIPQIPHTLVQMLSAQGDKVWDPFGGSGTTALEALRLGRDAVSTDINPVATLVGRAKTQCLSLEDESEVEALINKLELIYSTRTNLERVLSESRTHSSGIIPKIPNIERWFSQNVVEELVLIKLELNKLNGEAAKTLGTAAFSKIITRASNQDGETRYVSKPKNLESGHVIKIFKAELKSIYSKARTMAQLLKFRKAEFLTTNLVKDEPVEAASIDLVVTSPPYPNATDYHLYHRFRIYWLGFNPQDIAGSEIGSHLRHQRNERGIEEYLEEMEVCLAKTLASLKQGKYAVFVIGDSVFQKKEYKTAELVGEVADKLGFEVLGIIKRPVHATKRSFIGAARRLREEKLLVLRKPTASQTFELFRPRYKLWEYEDKIRDIENQVLLSDKEKMASNIKRLTFTHHFSIGGKVKEPTWQAILENGDVILESSRKDPKYVTHGLHAYKGKFYPQLAKSLINISGAKTDSAILDPFCGSGTVMLESYLNGYRGIGMDLNPLAVKIAKAKVGILKIDPTVLEKTTSNLLEKLAVNPYGDKDLQVFEDTIDEVLSWFAVPIAQKIGRIIGLMKEVPDPIIRDFLEVCLSSIVRGVSQQEPKDLRIRRRSEPLEDAPVFELYRSKVSEQCSRILKFHSYAHKAPGSLGNAKIHLKDCRASSAYHELGIKRNSIDLVVTSPPYATALPYIDTDRLSILLLFGLRAKTRNEVEESLIGAREIRSGARKILEEQIERLDFSAIHAPYAKKVIEEVYMLNKHSNVGFRRKNMGSLLYRYFSDMSKMITNVNQVLKVGGQAFFVIGNNKTQAGDKGITIDSARFLMEAGEKAGWKLKQAIPITVTQENRFHNKNGITENDVIWMEKVS